MLVGGGSEVDERTDVRYADADPDRAVLYSLGDFDLIEVAGFPVVDR